MQHKKKFGRKVISYVLALVMVFSTMTGIVPGMSITAKAAGTEYQIWIAGTQVTSLNAGNVFAGDQKNDGKVTFTPADDTTPATLTLNGYSYEGDGGELNNQFFGILNKDADMPLNIKLQGENSVKLTGTGASYAIYSATDLTIEGDGSLEVAATGEKDYAIYGAKDMTVVGGTLNVEGGQYGIAVYGNFKTNGENVTINAKTVGAQGVAINGISSVVLNAGSVTVEGKYAGIISPSGTVTVNGGKIEAGAESGGIVGTTVNLNGGEIIAGGTNGYGVYAMGDNGLVYVGEQVTSLTATGALSAVNGKVSNAVPGTGWTNQEGTAGRKKIVVSAEGRSLASYKKIQFPPDHVHNFTYAAQGNTITATCDNANEKCNLNGNKIALTIVAPAVATNGNTKNATATLSNLDNFNEETELNVSSDSIKYYNATKSGDTYNKNGAALDSAPTDVGDYLAEITLAGVNTDQNEITSVSAVIGYTIKAPTPIAITINSAEHGAVTASVDGDSVNSAEKGTAVTLTATPDSGYYPNSITGTYRGLPSESFGKLGSTKTYFKVITTCENKAAGMMLGNGNSVTVSSVGTQNISKVVLTGTKYSADNVNTSSGNKSVSGDTLIIDNLNSVSSVTLTGYGTNTRTSLFYNGVTVYGDSETDLPLTIRTTNDVNIRTFTMPEGAVTITPVFDGATPVTGISLSETEVALTVGESVTLSATVTEADATYKTVTWTSDNEEVATVNNGFVNAVGGGTATITATADNGTPETTDDKIATCTVKVHAHNFVYSVTDNTIVRKCTAQECPLSVNPASLTITASNTGAELTGDTSVISPIPEVKYYHVNDNDTKGYPLVPITTAPKEVGKYWAEFTLGDKTAHIVYDVVPVVTIGEQGYSTLQEAINHVNDGDTIKLLSDVKERITFNKSEVTATLDLNGYTINGNQQGTVLTIQKGTFVLDDSSEGKTGVITGGTQGVDVNGSSTFKMNAGTIQGNIGNVNGAGVSVANGATFEMTGGTIQYNSTTSYTGGVLLNGGSTFIMSGGIVQYNNGGNNGYGGLGIAGVQPKISGTAVVKGNVMGGAITKTEAGYTLTGGTPCDVRNKNATAKVEIAGKLEDGAQIGVYNYTGDNAITTGYKDNNETDDADKFFFSNDVTKLIAKNEEGELIFSDDIHDFEYTADGSTITATCKADNCGLKNNKIEFTIAKPAHTEVSDGKSASAILDNLALFKSATGLDISDSGIEYYNANGTKLDAAPTGLGTYTAKITVAEKTASVDYTIVQNCGDGVTCSYNSATKTLTISKTGEGTGVMSDYDNREDAPWNVYKDEAEKIVIEDGVTGIGKNAFTTLTKATSATIAKSVAAIGENAFAGCTALTTVTFEPAEKDNTIQIGNGAFAEAAKPAYGEGNTKLYDNDTLVNTTAALNTVNGKTLTWKNPIDTTEFDAAIKDAEALLGKLEEEAYADIKSALEAAITNANTGINSSNTQTDADAVVTALKAAIKEAQDDKTDLDQNAVNDVIVKINAIGTVEYTAESKAKIDAARAAYDALTADQKEAVDGDTSKPLEKLLAAELEIVKLQAKADIDNQLDKNKQNEYDAEEWTAMTDAIAAAKEAMDAVTTSVVDVNTKKADEIARVNAVIATMKTKAEKLADAKKEATEELDNLLNGKTESEYDAEDWTEINTAITAGKTAIKDATDIAGVNVAKAEVEASVEEIKTKAEKLADAKNAAKEELEALLSDENKAKYDEEGWNAVKAAVEAGEKAIEDAEDTAGVDTVLNETLASVTKVKTKAEKALDAAKNAAKEELEALLSDENKAKYDAEGWKAVQSAIEAGKAAIEKATDETGVNTAKEAATTSVEAVKTISQKELEAAKEAAKKELDALLSDENKAKYDAEGWKAVQDAVEAGKAAINKAADEAGVNTAKEEAATKAEEVKTKAQKALEIAKEAAKKELDKLLSDENKAKYDKEGWKAVQDAVEAGKKAIYEAKDEAGINSAKEAATAKAEEVKTIVQKAADKLAADKEAFEADKEVQKKAADTLAAEGDSDASKKLIEDAKKAIDALTFDENKSLDENKEAIVAIISKLNSNLTAKRAEEKKDADDTAAAKKVADAINALPASDKATTTDKEAIEAARKAYDALSPDQKKKVSADVLKKLTDAENALKAAEKDSADKTAADKVIDEINKLPASDKITTADKVAIVAARKAYDALTADQKKKVPADVLKKLEDAEKALADAEAKDKAAKELEAAKQEAQASMNEQVTVTQKGNKFTVKWKKSSSADGYYVYASYCGKKAAKPAKTITKNTTTKTTITKINGKKINQKKNFHVYVVPYKIIDGKKVTLGKSTVAHLVGSKNAKYSNVKKLTLTKSKYTVKVGKTKKIKAKVTLVNKNKKHIPKSHGAKFRYKSSDTGIATVDKNGKIKGIKKGTCTIYVYSINGLMKKAKVTVK